MVVTEGHARLGVNGAEPDQADELLIQMLGGFTVSVGSRPIDQSAWPLRKTRNLLKILALAPSRRIHREHIIDVLWPEQDAEAAANNLHKSLLSHSLRLRRTQPRSYTSPADATVRYWLGVIRNCRRSKSGSTDSSRGMAACCCCVANRG